MPLLEVLQASAAGERHDVYLKYWTDVSFEVYAEPSNYNDHYALLTTINFLRRQPGLLGHSNIDTTAVDLQFNDQDLHDVVCEGAVVKKERSGP